MTEPDNEMYVIIPIPDEPDARPHYVREFPAFAGVEPPDLPPDFEDCSWRNDEAPSWISPSRGCRLFMFHPDVAKRSPGMTFRYSLVSVSTDGDEVLDSLALTDDWANVVAALPALEVTHPKPRRSVQIDADLLHRIEANMAWLLRIAAPHCGSEPESYDLADAAAAHADLAAILAGAAGDST